MGSSLIFNDTLNLNATQGFPKELVLERHIKNPFLAKDFNQKAFQFKKPELRFYHPLPIRVFLVQNIKDKWIYWGMVHVLNVTLDYEAKTTSGTYKIVDIFTFEDMKKIFKMRDARPDFDYLSSYKTKNP